MKRITASYAFFIAASLSLLGTALLESRDDSLEHAVASTHQSPINGTANINKDKEP